MRLSDIVHSYKKLKGCNRGWQEQNLILPAVCYLLSIVPNGLAKVGTTRL